MNNQYVYYNTDIDKEAELAVKKRMEKRELRGRCISTGILCLISLVVFSVIAMILLPLSESILSDTPFYTDSNLSLIPGMVINSLVSLIGFGVVSVLFCKATKTDLSDIFPSDNMSFKKLAGVVLIGFTVCICSNYIAQLFAIDLSIFGLETMYDDAATGSTSIIEHLVYIVSVSIVPAVTEEFIYRGCVMGRLRKFGDGFALVTSALLFGMMHGNFTQAPFAFVVGLAAGWAVLYTGSIFPAMLIHGMNNLISVLSDIAFENFEIIGINETYVEIGMMIFFAAMFTLAFVAAYKLSRNDKEFGKLKPYEGLLTFKERIKTFFTSATIIIFLVLTLIECLLVLKVIE